MSFEYDPSEFLSLAVTIKKLTNDPVMLDYVNIINEWQDKRFIISSDFIFEKDSKGKLHLHGIIVVRKNFYKRKLQTIGYHVYTTDIYDIEVWKNYINKCSRIDNDKYMLD